MQFRGAAYYDDLIAVDISVIRVGVKSLTMSIKFRRGDQQLAIGELKTVFCRFERGGKFKSIAIPAGFAEKLDEMAPGAGCLAANPFILDHYVH